MNDSVSETAVMFVLGYLAIDFICTMLNKYVFKNEPSARA